MLPRWGPMFTWMRNKVIWAQQQSIARSSSLKSPLRSQSTLKEMSVLSWQSCYIARVNDRKAFPNYTWQFLIEERGKKIIKILNHGLPYYSNFSPLFPWLFNIIHWVEYIRFGSGSFHFSSRSNLLQSSSLHGRVRSHISTRHQVSKYVRILWKHERTFPRDLAESTH